MIFILGDTEILILSQNGVQNGILTREEQFTTLEACTPYLLYNYSGNEVEVSGYYDEDTKTDNLVTAGYLTGPVYTAA